MKVWVTKYALTRGIIETEIDEQTPGITFFMNGMHFDTNAVGVYWHTTKKGAVLRAEQMRQEKIVSLKKQIEKLEGMKFEKKYSKV